PPTFKTSPPRLIDVGEYLYEPPVWQIIEDVIKQSVTVKLYGGDTVILPHGVTLFNSEKLEMTAYHQQPAYARMYNEVIYKLRNHGYETEIRATGSIHSTVDAFHIDIQLLVHLNGNRFFEKSWLESIPRQLL
ncbi:MAG: hypothetical protein KDE47_30495, partial [Caldilineaceae bacterium]|nr:hypothetical protein [Caldilineaceae bacterium]